MATFVKGGGVTTPFGRNEYLRSTRNTQFESYTLAASTITAQTIDGVANQKIVQPGTVMAKITSGGEAGKVGPYKADATDGRQTLANVVGVNDTFLPWQTIERDVEIGVMYHGTAVQAWCFEYNASGALTTLSNTVADAMRGVKGLDVTFK